jgi:hypothetical protein
VLKVVYKKRQNNDQAIRALAQIFISNDIRRQKKRVDELKKKMRRLNDKKTAFI